MISMQQSGCRILREGVFMKLKVGRFSCPPTVVGLVALMITCIIAALCAVQSQDRRIRAIDYSSHIGGGAALAISVFGEKAYGYLCDGHEVGDWFSGAASGDGAFELNGPDGARLSGKARNDHASGILERHGSSTAFDLKTGRSVAMYKAVSVTEGHDIDAGWIFLPDGTQTGVVNRNATRISAPPLSLPASRVTITGTVLNVIRIGRNPRSSPAKTLVPEPSRGEPEKTLVPEPSRGEPEKTLVPEPSRGEPEKTLVPEPSRGEPEKTLVPEPSRGEPEKTLVPEPSRGEPEKTLVPEPSRGEPEKTLVPEPSRGEPEKTLVPEPSRG
ncbi:hypothetical protein OG985_46040 [Streptomyces sp. NBC_00289]|uniref:hypothetical protein n=1 Tax=Streptomyces sp. NBC_00289 TaxID=2975703 RepID=UPI0032469A47